MSVFTTLGALTQFKTNLNDTPYWYWETRVQYPNFTVPIGSNFDTTLNCVAVDNTSENIIYGGKFNKPNIPQIKPYILKTSCNTTPANSTPSINQQYFYDTSNDTNEQIYLLKYNNINNKFVTIQYEEQNNAFALRTLDIDGNLSTPNFTYLKSNILSAIDLHTEGNINSVVGILRTPNTPFVYTGYFASFDNNTIVTEKNVNDTLYSINKDGNNYILGGNNSICSTVGNLSTKNWDYSYVNNSNIQIRQIIKDNSNNFIVYGIESPNLHLFKINSNGNIIWSKYLDNSTNILFGNVTINYNINDNIICLTSLVDSANANITWYPGLTLIENSTGNLIQSFKFGFSTTTAFPQREWTVTNSIIDNSNIIITGTATESPLHPYSWGFKYPATGQQLTNGSNIILIPTSAGTVGTNLDISTQIITIQNSNLTISNGNMVFSNITGSIANLTTTSNSNIAASRYLKTTLV